MQSQLDNTFARNLQRGLSSKSHCAKGNINLAKYLVTMNLATKRMKSNNSSIFLVQMKEKESPPISSYQIKTMMDVC